MGMSLQRNITAFSGIVDRVIEFGEKENRKGENGSG